MKDFLGILKYVAIALAGVAIVAGLMSREGLLGKRNAERADPKLINFDEFIKPIDPAKIGYIESKAIALHYSVPRAMAIDANDNIYVAGDGGLLVFDRNGQRKTSIELQREIYSLSVFDDRIYAGANDAIGGFGLDGESMQRWTDIAPSAHFTSILATEAGVFAADARNKVIWHYDLNGKQLQEIGKRDVANGRLGFIVPGPFFDIAPGYAGGLWAVNPGKHQLENYTFAGELRSSWRRASVDIAGFCGCCNPTQMAILPDGGFVTAEKGIPRVKVHDPNGDLRTVVAGPELFAEGTVIADVAIDSQNRVYVLDPVKKAIRIFEKK